jgi:hypothetical protein
MGALLLKVVLAYLEKHPDQIVELLHAAVAKAIHDLEAQP